MRRGPGARPVGQGYRSGRASSMHCTAAASQQLSGRGGRLQRRQQAQHAGRATPLQDLPLHDVVVQHAGHMRVCWLAASHIEAHAAAMLRLLLQCTDIPCTAQRWERASQSGLPKDASLCCRGAQRPAGGDGRRARLNAPRMRGRGCGTNYLALSQAMSPAPAGPCLAHHRRRPPSLLRTPAAR